MSAPPGFDRFLTAWLDDEAPMGAPDGLLALVADDVHRTRRRPGWATLERWIPMDTRARIGPGTRAAITLTTIAALTAVAGIAIALAAQPSPPPPPTGVARNGLVAYDAFGDIWVMRPDGTDRRQLTSGPAIDVGTVWSPDGTRIAYVTFPNTVEVDPTGANFESILQTWLIGNGTLMIMAADGSDTIEIGSVLGTDAGSWSPDSTQLVTAIPDGTMRVANADGTDARTLARGMAPAWSPDGAWIAYQGGSAATSDLGVWIISSDGSGARLITEPLAAGDEVHDPDWSADGGSIAFYAGPAGGGRFDIRVARADGGPEAVITTGGPDEYQPVWAPDGTRLAFNRVTVPSNNLAQVVLSDPDGSNQVMLGSGALFGLPVVWSPDATELVGQLPADAAADSAWGWASHLVFLDASGAEPPRLVEAPGTFYLQSWQRLAP